MTDGTAGVNLILDGCLTMRTVDAVHAQLRQAIEQARAYAAESGLGAIVSLDCSAAAEVDLTFVQLLVATRLSARLRGGTAILSGAPEGVLLETLRRGGFEGSREDAPGGGEAFWFRPADSGQ